MNRVRGFEPFVPPDARVLILGSFPSVKSRADGFYYGNPQNRFWRMLASFFGEALPSTVEEKRSILLKHRIALWDMVASCEIQGSADASIREEEEADVRSLVKGAGIERILLNGTKAYALFSKRCEDLLPLARLMPSTSPANPRYREDVWHLALAEALK